MKKFALFAMLLGSSFVFGCEKPAEKPKDKTPPVAGATDAKDKEATPPADKPADAKPADATPPAEPAK